MLHPDPDSPRGSPQAPRPCPCAQHLTPLYCTGPRGVWDVQHQRQPPLSQHQPPRTRPAPNCSCQLQPPRTRPAPNCLRQHQPPRTRPAPNCSHLVVLAPSIGWPCRGGPGTEAAGQAPHPHHSLKSNILSSAAAAASCLPPRRTAASSSCACGTSVGWRLKSSCTELARLAHASACGGSISRA